MNCRVCKEVLNGPHIAAGEDGYHPDCFRCIHCLELLTDNYCNEDDGFYCEADHTLLFAPRCAKCTEVIIGKCINALDQKWHIDHFVCENCARPLAGTNFVRKDDKPYCKLCPTDGKKKEQVHELCDQCRLPILQQPLIFRGLKLHHHHFHCFQCQQTLDTRAREFDDELYCFTDYEKLLSKVCHACRLPIIGVSVSCLGKMYHPEHFVCSSCGNPFNGSPHFEHEGKPYCELHFKEVTGALCRYCWKPVQGQTINALEGSWCSNHFQCMGCFINLSNLEKIKFVDFDGKPFCQKCFDKVSGDVKRNILKYRDKEKSYV